MSDKEITIYEGSPSQIENLSSFIILGILTPFTFGLALIPILFTFLKTKFHIIKITNERIIDTSGILSKTVDELELYRVKDVKLEKPFLLRMFGLGNIMLITSDKTSKKYFIKALKDSEIIREKLRKFVEERRIKRGVREVDFE